MFSSEVERAWKTSVRTKADGVPTELEKASRNNQQSKGDDEKVLSNFLITSDRKSPISFIDHTLAAATLLTSPRIPAAVTEVLDLVKPSANGKRSSSGVEHQL